MGHQPAPAAKPSCQILATIVFGLRPYPASILRVAALTLALAGGVLIVNLWLSSNPASPQSST